MGYRISADLHEKSKGMEMREGVGSGAGREPLQLSRITTGTSCRLDNHVDCKGKPNPRFHAGGDVGWVGGNWLGVELYLYNTKKSWSERTV